MLPNTKRPFANTLALRNPGLFCPNCYYYSKMDWSSLHCYDTGNNDTKYKWSVVYCQLCQKESIWNEDVMVFPKNLSVQAPNKDLNEEIKEIYGEAAMILDDSPRAAVALLRLCIQMLRTQLGQPGKDINKDIGTLVSEKKIDTQTQRALDIIRVLGNEAVHPGQIDLNDNKEIAESLFKYLNHIAQETFSKPKEREALFGSLPPEKLKGIKNRDSKSKKLSSTETTYRDTS